MTAAVSRRRPFCVKGRRYYHPPSCCVNRIVESSAPGLRSTRGMRVLPRLPSSVKSLVTTWKQPRFHPDSRAAGFLLPFGPPRQAPGNFRKPFCFLLPVPTRFIEGGAFYFASPRLVKHLVTTGNRFVSDQASCEGGLSTSVRPAPSTPFLEGSSARVSVEAAPSVVGEAPSTGGPVGRQAPRDAFRRIPKETVIPGPWRTARGVRPGAPAPGRASTWAETA